MNKVVKLSVIQSLKPCQNRLDNYIKFYGNREFTPNQFMGLRNITHSDKLWVAFRLMPQESLGKAAAEIALSVLPIYEKQYPNDSRPRKAIEAFITGTMTPGIIEEAYADAADAAYAAACVAADAYADAADAAYAAACVAYIATTKAAACARSSHDKLIRKICLKYWKKG